MNGGQNASVNPREWAPLPPPPGPVGSGRRPWLLPVLALLTVLVTTGAVFGVAKLSGDDGDPAEPPTPMSTTSATPSGSAAPAAQDGGLTTIPAPCTLVPQPARKPLLTPPVGAQRLGPVKQPGQDGHSAGCRWRTTRPEAPQQRTLTVLVVLRTDQAGQSGQDKVTARLEAARRAVRRRAGTSVTRNDGSVLRYGTYRQVPGVGEDAFAVYTDEQAATGRTGSAVVWARYRNALLKVTFEGADSGAPLAESAAVDGATAAARALVQRLQG